ncbi:hypothetical protein CVT25_004998 [Psilocybe cyanescens]|uniref:Uncharacterized protein n=1 Tax=Psilocybe cyanescens TaxID=93625 RepID=A0A409X286_PSICY|nr:hypothetical protein CVT25_004998 [Psilocybe cyanescens]
MNAHRILQMGKKTWEPLNKTEASNDATARKKRKNPSEPCTASSKKARVELQRKESPESNSASDYEEVRGYKTTTRCEKFTLLLLFVAHDRRVSDTHKIAVL